MSGSSCWTTCTSQRQHDVLLRRHHVHPQRNHPFVVVFALFGRDVQLAYFPKSSDITFVVLTVLAMVLFTIEIIASTVGKAKYVGSFFFYLDVGATGSMLLDIQYFAERFVEACVCSNSKLEPILELEFFITTNFF